MRRTNDTAHTHSYSHSDSAPNGGSDGPNTLHMGDENNINATNGMTPKDAGVRGLNRLPAEIIHEIFRQCGDFTAVWALMTASRRMLAIFERNALDIVTTTLGAALPFRITHSVREIANVRSGAPALQQQQQEHDSPDNHDSIDIGRLVSPKQDQVHMLGRAGATMLMRRLVTLAHRIHVLSHLCLDHMLRKCTSAVRSSSSSSAAASPSSSPSQQCSAGTNDAQKKAAAGAANTTATATARAQYFTDPLDRQDLDRLELDQQQPPPSWKEELQVIWALWGMQFFYELKAAGGEGRLSWWGEQDLEMLSQDTLETFYSGTGFARQQIRCVLDALKEITATSDEVSSWDEKTQAVKLPTPSKGFQFKWACEAVRSSHSKPSAEPDLKAGQDLTRNTVGWDMFWAIMGDPHAGWLRFVPFDPYRNIGFAIWDAQRMVQLGFGSAWSAQAYPLWRSVLPEEHIAKAQRLHKEDE